MFPHSITTLQVLFLYSQSLARLEQNLNLTGRINELTEENSLAEAGTDQLRPPRQPGGDWAGSGCVLVQTVLRARPNTGMVLVEVELLTGWRAVSPERLTNQVEALVRRVDLEEEDNILIKHQEQ